MSENFAVGSPVAEMIRASGLSKSAVARRFRQATGLSPIACVQQVRIDQAKRKLEESERRVDQISWEVGYEDAAAFRRLFKRIARVTPGACRRKFAPPALT